jgi:hypothetical protein
MLEFTTISNARKQTGLSYLGGVSTSSKIAHSQTYSHQHTYAIYLAPANVSGYNVCSHSTPECRSGCLNTSGRAGMDVTSGKMIIHNCRVKKTRLFYEEPEFFMAWMIAEIKYFQKRAERKGFFFSVRLNATSDIDWQNVTVNGQTIFEIFPDILFYDYTKNINKFIDKPLNYHLTYSYTGRNELQCEAILKAGFNVACVFNIRKEVELPKYFDNYPVINGDLTDYRIDDAKGIIVGLKWKRIANRKAEAMLLKSCFVIDPVNNKRCSNVQKEVKIKVNELAVA